MLCRCLRLFARKRSRYISWNSLFLWAFGLWIALCTSDVYRSDVLSQEAAMLCQQNSNSGIACNIAIRPEETMENPSYIDATNCNFCNIVLAMKTLFQSIYMLLFVCLVVPLLCMHDHVKRNIERPSNIANNLYSIGKYLKAVAKYCKENVLDGKMTDENDPPPSVLRSELIAKCEIRTQQLRATLIHNEECALEGNRIKYLFNASIRTVDNEITLGCYTLLLFNNYELYRYFDVQLVKSTCHLFAKYPVTQDPGYVVNDGKWLNDECKAISSLELKSGMRKRIISSSPEFQMFLASLKRSGFLYPCMLEVSCN